MKSFFQAVATGLIGALATSLAFALDFPVWVVFVCWVSYYVFGKTATTAVSTFVQQLLGIAIAIAIQIVGTLLGTKLGGIGLPLVQALLVGALTYVTKAPILNILPAYFTGMIIWHSQQAEPRGELFLELALTMLIGHSFAWLNDYVHTWLEAREGEPKDDQAEAVTLK